MNCTHPIVFQLSSWTTALASILALTLVSLICVEQVSSDITIVDRNSFARLRVFTGAGGAANTDDVQDSTQDLTGIFTFDESFFSSVLESDPFSTGSADASGSIFVLDYIFQASPSSIMMSTTRISDASVAFNSGGGAAASAPRHDFRVRFMVTGEPVRYTISGIFAPGPLLNGLTTLSLYRPFTAITFFEYDSFQELDQTGVLQPGLTYEIRVRVDDDLSASVNSPDPKMESTNYSVRFNVATILLGDVNLDDNVNLLDVQPFIELISAGGYQAEADINGDGLVNLLDVQPFVNVLSGN